MSQERSNKVPTQEEQIDLNQINSFYMYYICSFLQPIKNPDVYLSKTDFQQTFVESWDSDSFQSSKKIQI